MKPKHALFAIACAATSMSWAGPQLATAQPRGPSLPSLPTLPRLRIEAAKDHITVVHELNLPKGDWAGGDLDLFAAFGAPATPRAVDARLYPLAATEPAADATGESVVVEPAARRPSGARLLLGAEQMSGVTLKLREAALRRALAYGAARIRLRELLDLPGLDTEGGREVVIRLGVREGPPLAVGGIELASLEPAPWITRAEAHLCGPDADAYPLAVSVLPRPSPPPRATWPAPTAPLLAVRHSSDDLCVRFWAP